MIGIGTPSSQRSAPRAIVASAYSFKDNGLIASQFRSVTLDQMLLSVRMHLVSLRPVTLLGRSSHTLGLTRRHHQETSKRQLRAALSASNDVLRR
jgi:hypothetical protein